MTAADDASDRPPESARAAGGASSEGSVRREQERYVRGLKYSGYDMLTALVLGLISAVATARVFGAQVIGAFALATLLTGSLHMISNVREQGGLVRELASVEPRSPDAPALLWTTLAFSFAITLVVLAPFAALAVVLLSDVFDRPELVGPFAVMAVGYLVLDNTSFNLDAPLVAFRDGRALWIARSGVTLAMIAGAAACALLDQRSIWGLATVTLLASVTGLALRCRALHRLMGLRTHRADLRRVRPRLRSIVSFGVRQMPLNYTETAIEYTDTAVLGANVSLAGIGAYNRAYALYRRAGQVPIAVSRLYFPTLAALHVRDELAAMVRVHRLSSRYLTLLLLPAATWLAACAPGILAVFGPGFGQAAGALEILAFVVVLDGFARMTGGLLTAVDRPGIVSLVTVGSAGVNIALCLALIGPLGLEGAALANAGGWLLECGALYVLAAAQLRLPARRLLDGAFLARLLGACAVAGVALVALRGLPWALAWQLLATLPAFGVALLAFRPLPRASAPSIPALLASAGVRSPRLVRLAAGLHDRFGHGAPQPAMRS